jgi:hypothetical protein
MVKVVLSKYGALTIGWRNLILLSLLTAYLGKFLEDSNSVLPLPVH